MHKSNEDCFYFLTSSCAKGVSCTYRHSPLALTCNVTCPAWIRGNCLDPACPLRHSAIQRPTNSNGILCFYENTPMGCLKVDCTFIHSRPRLNSKHTSTIRPSSTNFINKDTIKPIVSNTSPIDIPQTAAVSGPPTIINPTQTVIPIATVETPSKTDIPASIVKTETIPRRIAVSSENEQSDGKMNLLNNNNTSLIKSTVRCVITDSSKRNQEEISTSQSRLVANRNVVIDESTSVPSRKIVQATSSNRVVVSSETIHSSSRGKKNDIDQDNLVEQENDTKKFKKDTQSVIDIPFPCSTPSITNRLLFTSSKETSSTNDTKPIRLNRHRLPVPKTSSGNSSISVSTLTNEEKTSPGTGLSQDDERRTSRIERFKKNLISPPRSIICSSSTTTPTKTNSMTLNASTSRNIITSAPNERKRTAPETTIKDLPVSKRASTAASSSSSKRRSPPRQTASSVHASKHSSSSPVSDANWKKQADEFIAKAVQSKNSSPATTTQPQPMSLSSVRPRFTPQPIVPPSPLQPTTRTPRIRQPPSVVLKRPLVPVTAPSRTSTKTIEQIPSNVIENNVSSIPKSTVELKTSTIANEEDENQLLTLDESSDVVDTFALIDEALLEADHLLELM